MRKSTNINEPMTTELIQTEPPAALAVAPPEDRPPALTTAQARVDSVARTMDAAMNKASTLQLTPEEIAMLKAEFPDDAFKPGAAGKEQLIYIEHAHLRDRFDAAIGMGQWALIRTRPHWAEEFKFIDKHGKEQAAARVYADVALLIRGCMVSEAIGEMVYYLNNAGQNYGDAAEGAVTAAFRRCAKNFGVGLQAWKKDFSDGWWTRKRGQAPRQDATKAPPAPVSSAAAPQPKVWTPADWLAWLMVQCAPYPAAAREVFSAHGLLVDKYDSFDSLTLEQLTGWTGADVKRLAADVAARAAADNQIPGAEAPTEGQGAPASAPEPPLALPPGCQSRRITVKAKSAKSGAKKNGVPYTRHGVCSETDEWFNTFSDSIAAKAVEGQSITVWFTTSTYGNDLHAIT